MVAAIGITSFGNVILNVTVVAVTAVISTIEPATGVNPVNNASLFSPTAKAAVFAHPELYSFNGIVYGENLRARYILAPDQIPAAFTDLYILASDEGLALDDVRMNEYAVWLSGLNAVLMLELDLIGYRYSPSDERYINSSEYIADPANGILSRLGNHFNYLYAKQSYTAGGVVYPAGRQQLLNGVGKRIVEFWQFIDNCPFTGSDGALQRAYWGYVLAGVTANIRTAAEIFNVESADAEVLEMYEDWANYFSPTQGANLMDWYKDLLADYLGSL